MNLAESIRSAKLAMELGRDLPWLLRSVVEKSPDKAFLVWEPFTGAAETWTYRRFRDEARAVAASLQERGVEFGDRVMLHLDNSPEFLLAWFACAEVGAVAVSTNTRSVARDMTYFADHAGVVAAITSPRFAHLVNESAPEIRFLALTDTDAGEPPTEDELPEHVPFADLLAPNVELTERPTDPTANLGIQFTSGTTSRPKAVLWTHANALWGAEVNVAHMRLRSDDITLAFLPMFHTNAQSYSMLSTLWSGGTMVMQPRFSSSRFWDVAVRNRVTWCSMIGFAVKAVTKQEIPTDHCFRFWGPAVRLPEVEEALGITTIGWWGMTETITQGILGSMEHPGPRLSIGRPSSSYEISIRRDDGSPIEPGERGQLYIRGVRGVSLFKEYFRNPEATAEAFDDDGWFDTGDLIRMGDDGSLYFSDRAKDMLKVGAENVAASEIEAVIMEAGLTTEVAVVGQPHAMLDEVPVAFVIAKEPGADVSQAIIDACAANLADFKVPRAVHVVDELPRSTLEKIAKAELRKGLPKLTS